MFTNKTDQKIHYSYNGEKARSLKKTRVVAAAIFLMISIVFVTRSETTAQEAMVQEIVQIAAGRSHTVVLKKDGSIWAWGNNRNGQLGDDTTTDRWTPKRIGNENDWAQITADDTCTIAIKKDGSLWAWGYKSGVIASGVRTPQRLGDENDWIQIATSDSHAVALKKDGSLWAWGSNNYGQIGDGTTTDRPAHNKPDRFLKIEMARPTRIGEDNDWVQIAAGANHTAALKKDGSLWAWGQNIYGQLGNGTNTDHNPIPTKIMDEVMSVSTGDDHTIVIKTDGSLWAWGKNEYINKSLSATRSTRSQITGQSLTTQFGGQLGDGSVTNRRTPTLIGKDNDWTKIFAVINSTFAIKKDGSVWAWGFNAYGQLGDGTTNDSRRPKRIGKDTDWVQIAAGINHTVVLKKDGSVWTWGSNSNGELGNGTTENNTTRPTRVEPF